MLQMVDESVKSSQNGRRDEIRRLLRERTTASIAELAGHFDVSQMTIRRDLYRLAEAGEVIRIPGGARVARGISFEKSFSERLQKMAEAKDCIGRLAASLVREGDSVLMDSGTTTLCIARHLRSRANIVVLTYSLAVLDELAGSESVRIELTGGVYRHSSHDLVGGTVGESLAGVYADKVFFGAAAVSFSKGVMVYDPEAPRQLLRAGAERILVADSGKIGAEALYGYCRLDQCDLVITDSGVKPSDLNRLRKVTRVMVAE